MDDLIQRQAVDTLVDELARAISDERCCISRGRSTATIMQNILDLPSVKPQICEDAISRQAVLDLIADYDLSMGQVVKAIHSLPSVTPQEPRKGHWVKTPKAVMGEGYMWYCDKCEHQVYQDSSKSYPSEKYCPNCGAKMVEEQESEE